MRQRLSRARAPRGGRRRAARRAALAAVRRASSELAAIGVPDGRRRRPRRAGPGPPAAPSARRTPQRSRARGSSSRSRASRRSPGRAAQLSRIIAEVAQRGAHERAPATAGTPLAAKLGLKPGMRVAWLGAPEGFAALLGELPTACACSRAPSAPLDLVVAFATRRSALARRLPALREAIRADGAAWVAWPKRSSGVPTDITEDVVRDVALPLGLVDDEGLRDRRDVVGLQARDPQGAAMSDAVSERRATAGRCTCPSRCARARPVGSGARTAARRRRCSRARSSAPGPGEEMFVARVTYEFLGAVPLAPLTSSAAIVRPGKRLQVARGRASQRRTRAVALARARCACGAAPWRSRPRRVAGQAARRRARTRASTRAVPGQSGDEGFHRTGDGDQLAARAPTPSAGPRRAWFRLRSPLVAGEEPTPLQRAVAAADFGNGVSRVARLRQAPVRQHRPDGPPAPRAGGRVGAARRRGPSRTRPAPACRRRRCPTSADRSARRPDAVRRRALKRRCKASRNRRRKPRRAAMAPARADRWPRSCWSSAPRAALRQPGRTIWTIAGNGSDCETRRRRTCGDRASAVDASLDARPAGLAVAGDGSVYVADSRREPRAPRHEPRRDLDDRRHRRAVPAGRRPACGDGGDADGARS